MTTATIDKFYIYVWLRPDGEPFYVGKGSGYRGRYFTPRNDYCDKIVNKIIKSGLEPKVQIVLDGLSESAALRVERQIINKIGRVSNGGILSNMTDGGEGVSGYSHNDETRELMRRLRTGRKHTAETRERMSNTHKSIGRPAYFRGKKLTEEHRRKVGDGVRGDRNGNYDHEIYTFVHDDLGFFTGTRREFIVMSGCPHSSVSGIIKGNVKSSLGWTIERR